MNDYRVHVGKLKRTNLSIQKQFVKTDAVRYEKIRKAIDKVYENGCIVIYSTWICDVKDMQEYLIGDCDFPLPRLSSATVGYTIGQNRNNVLFPVRRALW